MALSCSGCRNFVPYGQRSSHNAQRSNLLFIFVFCNLPYFKSSWMMLWCSAQVVRARAKQRDSRAATSHLARNYAPKNWIRSSCFSARYPYGYYPYSQEQIQVGFLAMFKKTWLKHVFKMPVRVEKLELETSWKQKMARMPGPCTCNTTNRLFRRVLFLGIWDLGDSLWSFRFPWNSPMNIILKKKQKKTYIYIDYNHSYNDNYIWFTYSF